MHYFFPNRDSYNPWFFVLDYFIILLNLVLTAFPDSCHQAFRPHRDHRPGFESVQFDRKSGTLFDVFGGTISFVVVAQPRRLRDDELRRTPPTAVWRQPEGGIAWQYKEPLQRGMGTIVGMPKRTTSRRAAKRAAQATRGIRVRTGHVSTY